MKVETVRDWLEGIEVGDGVSLAGYFPEAFLDARVIRTGPDAPVYVIAPEANAALRAEIAEAVGAGDSSRIDEFTTRALQALLRGVRRAENILNVDGFVRGGHTTTFYSSLGETPKRTAIAILYNEQEGEDASTRGD